MKRRNTLTKNRKITISVSLEPDQLERLDKIVRNTKVARSVLVREALQNIIDKYEEQLNLSFPEINTNK